MKAKYSFISLIMLVIYTFFSFMEGVWVSRYWRQTGYGQHSLAEEIPWMAYYRLIPSVIILLFVVLGIIVMILRLANKENFATKKGVFMPAVAFLIFVILAIYNVTTAETVIHSGVRYGYTEYGVGWAFYVCIVSLFIAAAIGVMMGIGKIKELNPSMADITPANSSNAPKDSGITVSSHDPNYSTIDELKKYKELLDTGVITQDEFDAKKKQLMGL